MIISNIKQIFKGFVELERFLEHDLGVSEKDFKKYIIFNMILAGPTVKTITEISLQPLVDLLVKEGKMT